MGLMERMKLSRPAWANTIVAFEPQRHLQDMGVADAGAKEGAAAQDDQFKIRLAYGDEHKQNASFLVKRRYSEAGYASSGPGKLQHCPEQITLLSYHQNRVVGTLTLGLDVGEGLHADELYRPEVDRLRAQGCKVSEITKLAMDSKHASKQVFAALIHISYIYCRKIWRYTDMVIEVNPSHVGFYKKMLGFTELGSERMCPRVNAPAILLWVEGEKVDKRIAEVGGRPELSKQDRSLYPYFFSREMEHNIIGRLLKHEQQHMVG